jgi:hypothetical protein
MTDAEYRSIPQAKTALIKEGTGANGNRLAFRTWSEHKIHQLTIHDLDCQKARTYTIGAFQWLGEWSDKDEEKMEFIISFEQVIEAWTSGKIWF